MPAKGFSPAVNGGGCGRPDARRNDALQRSVTSAGERATVMIYKTVI
jgi:hypothetical protein